MEMNRKRFFEVTLALSGVALGLASVPGCGDDDENGVGGNGGNGGTGGTGGIGGEGGAAQVSSCDADVAVAVGHTHSVEVPAADVNEASIQTYTTSLDAGHTHTVTLSAANLAALAGGGTATVQSSLDDGHTHEVTVSCA